MTDENKLTTDPTTTTAINITNNNGSGGGGGAPTTPISKSPSSASIADTSSEGTPSKHKKHGFSKRLTKMSLFGKMLRGGKSDHHSSSSSNNDASTAMVSSPSREQLNEYLQSSTTSITSLGPGGDVGDDTSSVMGEEEATILWEEDGNVKAATPIMLIRRVTDEKFVDANLITDVLVSYRSFTTPAGFLELLMKRFEYSSFVALRVCDVLKKWMEKQWCDFDTALTESLVSFIKSSIAKNEQLKNVADQLLKIIAKKSSKEEQRPASLSNPPNPPKPLLPLAVDELDGNGSPNLTDFGPEVTFWSFPSKEIARQLTIIEQKLYMKISPPELISQVWAKSNAQKLAPNVLALIGHFNKVSAWVCSEIVSTQDLQQRIEKVLQLIDIAQHFFTMNNFNSLMAVLAGLHSSSVHRMKRTWGGVTDKPKETFEWLTEFMSSAKNYSQYREQLQKAVPPVLPYLGVYLSDLTFIEDGNPGEIGNMVNFSKCRQLATVIRKILDFQQTPYTLVSVPFVQNYFNDFTPMDDKMAYEHSTKLEPRTMSTHQHNHLSMGSSTSAAAAAAVASLTSSLGVSDNYDVLGDSSDLLGDDPTFLGDSHLRFRKDLIRSRNNSLNNVGEPFPVKIQLPGSLPVEMRMPPNTTAKQAVKHFADFFSGINEQYRLVVMPSRTDAKGVIFQDDKIVKEIMDAREEDKVNTKLALFASPLVVNCGIFVGSSMAEWKDVLVDMGAPLFSLVAVFQDIFHTGEEFAYLAYNQQTKKAWWMNMHKSLEANRFERPACILVIYLLSNFLLKSVESLAGNDKQGVLLAGGREGTLKVTTMRQHFAVLSGPFLLLFKTKSESAPSEVVALERYSIQQPNSSKHVSVVLDRSAIFSNTGYAKSHYSLSSDTDAETRTWLRAFQRNCGLLGDKVIFGEELDRCAKQHLPSVVQKTINFIYSHALQQDGLFKSAANSSLVQHYKNQFDQGVEVEFTRTNDACTVAQLLLLYFQELPNPLLTYDLFPKFMEFGLKPPHSPEEEIEVLRDLVSILSHAHVTVLAFLLAFLSQVSIENPIKTGIANIFGPILMRPPPTESEPKNYKDVSKVVLGKLIKHREKVFIGIIARRASENVLATSATMNASNANSTPPEPKPTSTSPDNNDPLLKDLAAIIGKQLSDSAAIAKKVELLKSQLENKYKVRRQISFQDDTNVPNSTTGGGGGGGGPPGTPGKGTGRGEQHLSLSLQGSKSVPSYRNHKSVSFVTRPTFHESQGVVEFDEDS